jgi:hypothetical protein
MIIIRRTHGYGSRRKYIHGHGFIDSLSSTFRNVGSYVSQNKDLIAKPLLGAVGNLAATSLEKGGIALLNHIINKNSQNKSDSQNINEKVPSSQLDSKSLAILQNMIGNADIPISNIISGSGIKRIH